MTLTLTPHRRREPRKNRGIPTIPAGHVDGESANVSTVDTEPLTGSTPRGLPRSWRPGTLAPGTCLPFPCLTSDRPFLVPAWFPRSLPAVARRRCQLSRPGPEHSTRVGIY